MPRLHESVVGLVSGKEREVRIISGTSNEPGTVNLIIAKEKADPDWIDTVEVFDLPVLLLTQALNFGEDTSHLLIRVQQKDNDFIHIESVPEDTLPKKGVKVDLPSQCLEIGLPIQPLLMALENVEPKYSK